MNIGIIGVGRLGLAYALVFEKAGYQVTASSYKKDYVDLLQQRKTDNHEPGVAELLSKSNINFTIDNHEVIDQCDVIYVMVATPSTDQGDYDVSAVEDVVYDFLKHPSPVDNKILIIGSTVNPGCCEELQKILEHRGVHVVYCPTFAAQGTVLQDIRDPHTLLLGTEDGLVAARCQQVFEKILPVKTPIYAVHSTTAEILKLAGNCKATMEISFANMIGQILIASGREQDIIATRDYLSFIKRTVKWQFGYGFGGPCYPRDNRSMIHYANKLKMDYPMGHLVDEFNESHEDFMFDYLVRDNQSQLPFYFKYVSYKRNVNIFEESHQLAVCKKLLRAGHKVYIEPTIYLPESVKKELTQEFDNVEFVSIQDLMTQNITVYSASDVNGRLIKQDVNVYFTKTTEENS